MCCSSYIAAAHKEVSQLVKRHFGLGGKTRSPNLKISVEKKADIGKYAAENRIVAAVRHFSNDFPDSTLMETTMHDWKVKYLCKLRKRECDGKDLVVKALPFAKMGRPLMLGDDLDNKVQNYVMELRRSGGKVDITVIRAAAAGMVKKKSWIVSRKWGLYHSYKRLGLLFAAKNWLCKTIRYQ